VKWANRKAVRNSPQPKPAAKARKAKAKPALRKENAVVRCFRQTWAELKKVQWPNRRQATNLTLIVLAVTVGMSAFLGVVDWVAALFFSLLV
jgi:preprotein translocase subunit SecE